MILRIKKVEIIKIINRIAPVFCYETTVRELGSEKTDILNSTHLQ